MAYPTTGHKLRWLILHSEHAGCCREDVVNWGLPGPSPGDCDQAVAHVSVVQRSAGELGAVAKGIRTPFPVIFKRGVSVSIYAQLGTQN